MLNSFLISRWQCINMRDCPTDPLHWPTFDGESGLHASMDMVSHMTVEQPCAWVSSHHLHSLEGPREQIKDVCTVHKVRLAHIRVVQKNGNSEEEI